MTSISIGKDTYGFSKPLAALVDTGSTMVFLPKAILDELFKGADIKVADGGIITVPCQSQNLKSLGFHVGKYELSFGPDAYVIPGTNVSLSVCGH